VGKPVTASGDVVSPEKAVDGLYHNGGAGTKIPVAAAAPFSWIAINVGAGPDRVLLSWTDAGFTPYNVVTGGAPTGYEIATSGDSTSGSDGTWETVVTVTGNTVRTRAHTFAFTGKSWVKLTVTAGAAGGAFIDEIAIHDVTQAGSGRPADTWFFMGDSITQGAFNWNFVDSFNAAVTAAHPAYHPVMLNGGIAYELSTDGLGHIDQWLQLNPDIQHFAIMYGTNDAAGDKLPDATPFQANMTSIVEKVLAAGRVPILARIPYSTTAHANVADFDAIVDAIATGHGLPCGPDLYGYFMAHPDQLSDGVHPTPTGYDAMNRLWADDVSRLYAN
jgi:lysophospholipase L1-like esterase